MAKGVQTRGSLSRAKYVPVTGNRNRLQVVPNTNRNRALPLPRPWHDLFQVTVRDYIFNAAVNYLPYYRPKMLSDTPLNRPTQSIHHLNEDILSYIFALNGDMFSDIHALRTTSITSQVCQRWRNLMLSTPTLWARLIDIDYFIGPLIDNWINELLRRSGTAPLWINSKEFPGDDIEKILFRILSENWHRTQKLIVVNHTLNSNIVPMLFGYPAPYLETFDVHLEIRGLSDKEKAFTAHLFSGHAPILRRFDFGHWVIDHRAPWLCNLHSLVLNRAIGVYNALAILTETPMLQKFETHLQVDTNMPLSYPTVTLPHLESLKCSGEPHLCTALLEHIEIPLNCSLRISTSNLYENLSSIQSMEMLDSVINTYSRYVKRFLQSNVFEIVHLYFDPSCNAFFKAEAIVPVKCLYTISIMLRDHSNTSHQLAMVLNKLALLDFSRTMKLVFVFPYQMYPSFGPLLLRFSSLRTLRINSTSLQKLISLQDGIKTTENSSILFPALEVVEFMQVYRDDVEDADPVAVAVKFTLSRIQNGHPIAVLDMSDISPFNSAPGFQALAEVESLKIVYKRLLKLETGESECVCVRQ